MVNLPSPVTATPAASKDSARADVWMATSSDRNVNSETLMMTVTQNVLSDSLDGCERYSDNKVRAIYSSRARTAINYAALNNGIRTEERNVSKRSRTVVNDATQVKPDSIVPTTNGKAAGSVTATTMPMNVAYQKVRMDHSYCKQINEGALISEQLRETRKRLREVREHEELTTTASKRVSNTNLQSAVDARPSSPSPVSNRPRSRAAKSQDAEAIGNPPRQRVRKSRPSDQAGESQSPPRTENDKKQVLPGQTQTTINKTASTPSILQAPAVPDVPPESVLSTEDSDDELRLLRQLEARERAQRERESALRSVSRTASLHDDFVVDLGGVRIRPSRRRASKLPPNAIELITAESQSGAKRTSASSMAFSSGIGMINASSVVNIDQAHQMSAALPVRTLIDPAYIDAVERSRSRCQDEHTLLTGHFESETGALLLDSKRLADAEMSATTLDAAQLGTSAGPIVASSSESPAKLVDHLADWLTAMRQDEAEVLLEELLDTSAVAPVSMQDTPASTTFVDVPLGTDSHVIDELVVTVLKNDERDALDCRITKSLLDVVKHDSAGIVPDTPATRTPQLTMVSMFWNDLPALLIDGVEYVRLVDIHKQMLPAKPTGLLKARAAQLDARIVPCTDMERDFLVRYAHAAPAKSNWCVSVPDAKRLVTYYLNPLNHHKHAAQVAPPTPVAKEPQAATQSADPTPVQRSARRSKPSAVRASKAVLQRRRRVEANKRRREQSAAAPSSPKRNAPKKVAISKHAESTDLSSLPEDAPAAVENDRSVEYYIESSTQFGAGVVYAAASGDWPTQHPVTHELSPDSPSPATPTNYRVPARMIVHTTAVQR